MKKSNGQGSQPQQQQVDFTKQKVVDHEPLQHRSSYNEELTHEERHLLSCTQRQAPQGEEVSHEVMAHNSQQQGQGQLESSRDSSECGGECDYENITSTKQGGRGPSRKDKVQSPCAKKYAHHNRNMSLDSSNSASNYNTLIIHQNNASLLGETWIPASHEFTMGIGESNLSSSPEDDNFLNDSYNPAAAAAYSSNNPGGGGGGNELSEIPRDYLNQLTVLKHLAQEVQVNTQQENDSRNKLLRSASFSKSQPDLSQPFTLSNPSFHHPSQPYPSSSSYSQYGQQPMPPSYEYASKNQLKKQSLEHSQQVQQQYNMQMQAQATEEPLPSVQILEILMRENASLKLELANARNKIQTINKLESELIRLSQQHANIVESAERRESLERTARVKLSSEVKRLTAFNRELISSSNSLQNLSPFGMNDVEVLKKEIVKKDLMLSQLIAQNNDINIIKERQEIEIAAQRATLNEQRGHIDILENALANSRNNASRLEEETRKKQDYVDKVTQLQRALASLQASNEKREQNEKKLRNQLESQVSDLKLQLTSLNVNASEGVTSGNRVAIAKITSYSPESHSRAGLSKEAEAQLGVLQEKLRNYEEKIRQMNETVGRWEQFFNSSNGPTVNHSNNSSQLTPYGASAPTTPNWVGGSRGGTPQHFFSSSDKSLDDGLLANRTNEFEKRIKDLEVRLMEKDVMLQVLNASNNYALSGGGGVGGGGGGFGNSPFTSNSSVASSSSNNPCTLPSTPPNYRESPSYQKIQRDLYSSNNNNNGGNMNNLKVNSNMYNKCDSEPPPTYANLPLRARMGGSGSSLHLAKNSNESLQSNSHGIYANNGSNNNGKSSGNTSSNTSNSNIKKSIDEQLKELDNQLLSKDGSASGTLYSVYGTGFKPGGLCCIPVEGFTSSAATTRKGKQSQPLLESIGGGDRPGKRLLPPYLPKSNLKLNSSNSGNQKKYGEGSNATATTSNSIRTSSGPPFLQNIPSSLSPADPSLGSNANSTSVDSNLNKNALTPPTSSSLNVFSPVAHPSESKGLPPRGPEILPSAASTSGQKSRSLERNLKNGTGYSFVGGEPSEAGPVGKYTQVNYDRCKSLDRKELKEEPSVKKSSVSSKALFFGGFLTRRSPSPCRDRGEVKEKEKSEKSPLRFPFGGSKSKEREDKSGKNSGEEGLSTSTSSSTVQSSSSSSDVLTDAATTALLDLQGRSSQRSRISKWSQLEAVEECGSEAGSPWVARRNSAGEGVTSVCANRRKFEREKTPIPMANSLKSNNGGEIGDKKWGKCVRTPFGLRYTVGNSKN